MAHFVELDENNMVIQVLRVPDEQEHRGEEFLAVDCNLGGRWVQTSYNTRNGLKYDENNIVIGPGFRKNYAGIGDYYDPIGDGFYKPKPVNFPSFVLDPITYSWRPPIPQPPLPNDVTVETHFWKWDEETVSWILTEVPSDMDIIDDPRLMGL